MCVCARVHMCTHPVLCMVPAEAREVVGFPELALPTAVCHHVGSGKQMGVKASTLNHRVIFPAPCVIF